MGLNKPRVEWYNGYAERDGDFIKITTFFDEENRVEAEEGYTHHTDYYSVSIMKKILRLIENE